MCRNIKTLFNFEPPATEIEIKAASEQYIRKISGFAKPSAANEAAMKQAIQAVQKASAILLKSLITTAPPKNRDDEAEKAHRLALIRFGAGQK